MYRILRIDQLLTELQLMGKTSVIRDIETCIDVGRCVGMHGENK